MLREYLLEDAGDVRSGSNGTGSIRTWMAVVGAALITIGGYLPWLRHNPDHEGVGIVLTPQLRTGFEGFDLVLLVPAALLMGFLAVRGPTKWWVRATAVVGVVAVLLPAVAAVDSLVETNPYFVPDLGLAVTTLGGVLLLVASGYDRCSAD